MTIAQIARQIERPTPEGIDQGEHPIADVAFEVIERIARRCRVDISPVNCEANRVYQLDAAEARDRKRPADPASPFAEAS